MRNTAMLVNRIVRLFSICVAALVICAQPSCKKQNSTGQAPQTVEQGMEQLRAALLKCSPEIQRDLYDGVGYNIRYGKNVEAMTYLDKIASDPSLTPDQKKLVGQVLDLLKQKVQGTEGQAK